MLALDEKDRTLVLILPDLTLAEKTQEIVAKFEERYFEVKAQKHVYLTEADLEAFFNHLPQAEREALVLTGTKGASVVLVLENVDVAIGCHAACQLAEELRAIYGPGLYCCSKDVCDWQPQRDIEFFFPHLDAMPVERTLVVIKPDALMRGKVDGKALEQFVAEEAGAAGLFLLGRMHKVLDTSDAQVLVETEWGIVEDHTRRDITSFYASEHGVVFLVLEGRGAIGKMNLIAGPADPEKARTFAPTSLRARWGDSVLSNAIHTSRNIQTSETELRAYVPEGLLKLQRTLCIVKPEAMANLLTIKHEVQAAGFTILKEKQTTLTQDRAKEFHKDLEGKPSFGAMVKEASAGSCCVMVLCRLEAVTVLNQLAGPAAVKDAKRDKPKSLRARFGRDGQRNGVHASESEKTAAREVRFFFPEMGADPIPDDDEVRDYLFRKSAKACMDLENLSHKHAADFTVDPTLQQLLSKGLIALCQVQPKGLRAVEWLSQWLSENNPNRPAGDSKFTPAARSGRFVEHGVNKDGMPFSVEAPREPASKKKVVDVDVSAESDNHRVVGKTPPFVVFVAGGPGCGKGTQCARLKEEFKLISLSTGDLFREEVAAGTYLGSEVQKHMKKGDLVPDAVTLQVLKHAMLKHQGVNRFLLDGFPRSLAQAIQFEQEIAEMSFLIHFEASHDVMMDRVAARALTQPGRPDNAPETVEKRIKVYQDQTVPVANYYGPIGKVRTVNADRGVDEIYDEVRKFFLCRFLYLLGPPGSPMETLAERIEAKFGYHAISLHGLLNGEELEKAKQCLAKGKPIDASIADPAIVREIRRRMTLGVQNFVLCDFPQSVKQAEFVEYQVPCVTKPLLLDFSKADAGDLAAAAAAGADPQELEGRFSTFFGADSKAMINAMPGLARVPCSLAALESFQAPAEATFADRLVEATWQGVCKKVKPGLTIVLGLPGCGTEVLAGLVASLAANVQAVDCNILLSREMERKTETGLAMTNMLAKGQIVPLSITLELLKGVVNLTNSGSIVVENCPLYADQIELISQEFRIDRVFYISGSDKAVAAWREAHLKTFKIEETAREALAFEDRHQRLKAIASHFSRLGKLEILEAAEPVNKAQLTKFVTQAATPQYVVVCGPSAAVTAKQSKLLAAAFAAGQPLALEQVESWTPADFRAHAAKENLSMLILDRFPLEASEALNLVENFGVPKLVVNLTCTDDFLREEYQETHDGEEPDEAFSTKLTADRAAYEACVKVFKERGNASTLSLDAKSAKDAEELHQIIRKKLLPQVFAVIAPSGAKDIGDVVATKICSLPAKDGARPTKMAVIDAKALLTRGGHSSEIEDALRKAEVAGGEVPVSLWQSLFLEAFASSANPLGSFIVINFPKQPTGRHGLTIRDQLALLENVASLAGVVRVGVPDGLFAQAISRSAEDLQAYRAFEDKAYKGVLSQLGPHMLVDTALSKASSPEEWLGEVAAKAAADFRAYQERSQ